MADVDTFTLTLHDFYIDAWILNTRSALVRIDYKIKHMCLLA